jgi:hypothetical protein
VLENFIKEYGFNPELFPESTTKDKPLWAKKNNKN